MISWWKPEITGGEASLLQGVLNSNFLNDGDVTAEFETRIAARIGARYAVATTSGTTALYMSLMALGVKQDDEVIVPDMTFIATANAVTMTGAKAVLVDVDPATLSMSAGSFEKAVTPRTRAVIPVHVSGRAGAFKKVGEVAGRHGIPVVEDAAEALGSKFNGRFLGTWGKAGCFSFSPNKTLTTGQGGMVVTDDEKLAARLRELKDQGRPVRGTGGDDLHPTLGFNFKFTNLQAAVGLGQMIDLDRRLERQRNIFEIYREELRGCGAIRFFDCDLKSGEVPQWTDVLAERRNELDAYLKSMDVHCRRFWHPLHTQAPYFQPDGIFPNSTELAKVALWLPSAFQMTDQDVRDVSSLILAFYRQGKRP
jgi:perosamine synthetase